MVDEEAQRGYLVLADISGYTSYLAGVELTHARDVLAELLELVVERFKPRLTIVKLEGDAVFAYVPQRRLPRGETLLEMAEATYLAFRDRVESIRRRTTCQCNACRSIPNLDLKFIVHFGEYLTQVVSGITELVGSDVNLVHRLLKNHVGETTGWRAYALFTEAALAQMNVKPEGLHEQTEAYEHLGQVTTHSFDLRARYTALVEARRVFISPDEADATITRVVQASPVTVWEWLNDVKKRLQWEEFDDIRPLLRPGGRMGAGARNHCAHGKNVVVEIIVDWQPFQYFTSEAPLGIRSMALEPLPEGTRLNMTLKLKPPWPRWLTGPLAKLMLKMVKTEQQFDKLVRLVADEAAGEEAGLPADAGGQ